MNDRIEQYFNEELQPPEREQFELELLHNSQLAEELAFYLQTKQVIREQVLAERHAEWQKMDLKVPHSVAPVRQLQPWYYAVAAVVLLAMAWIWLSLSDPNVRELSDAYIEENLTTLSVQMGGEADSLQSAIQYYNESQFAAAQTMGRELLQRNSNNAEALKLLGLIAIRQQNYPQAIAHFHQLGERRDLYTNPGKFYEALAYLQRNQPPDKEAARKLLQVVVTENLEGKPDAEKWLEAMDEK